MLAKFSSKASRQYPRLRALLVTLGSGGVEQEQLETVAKELARENRAKILLCTDTDPVCNRQCSTDIRASILHRWANAARDRGAAVCDWLKSGVNAGMTADPYKVSMVFFPGQETKRSLMQNLTTTSKPTVSQPTTRRLQSRFNSTLIEAGSFWQRIHRVRIFASSSRKTWQNQEEINPGPHEKWDFKKDQKISSRSVASFRSGQ